MPLGDPNPVEVGDRIAVEGAGVEPGDDIGRSLLGGIEQVGRKGDKNSSL